MNHMSRSPTSGKKPARRSRSDGNRPPLERRFAAFAAEKHPLLLDRVLHAFHDAQSRTRSAGSSRTTWIEALRKPFRDALRIGLSVESPPWLDETTPGVATSDRIDRSIEELVLDLDGFLHRESIVASFTNKEKRELLRGMMLTRAVDNQLKLFFAGGEVRYGKKAFQGKGFRSLGQEAIYGATLRLKRGETFAGDSGWTGDVVAPLIRDLGAALGMRATAETVRMVLNAQMGKAGPPMNGRDLHVGDWEWGVLPATAPLSISTMTVAGIAMGFALEKSERVAVSFIGEGGTSLGEWHEAINLCAARHLPAIFCIQNNQTALSTPVEEQSSVRVFAEKAAGYGVPGITIDGTDPEAIAAAFAWAAERGRDGKGPTLIELISMRMCGHAHHDDMLYLGKDSKPSWEYAELSNGGYADPEAYRFWSAKDPLDTYAAKLRRERVIRNADIVKFRGEAEKMVKQEARSIVEGDWPDSEDAGRGVFAASGIAVRVDPLDGATSSESRHTPPLPPVDPGAPFDSDGQTFLEAIMLGVGDALADDDRVFVYGQDVGGVYGNAFMLLRPLLERYGDRILNSTLAEGGILGVCVGAALTGRRPIGEIQFNDFVATGFNQLVNNAAKIHYRWGQPVPMTVRLPWGGLRHAGPYHSQNTEPWFYRVPGLKIVVPSTPRDARALFASAVADPNPVLFYEHIALYRDPHIKQVMGEEPPDPIPLGLAALRRAGSDMAFVSYGAYVHVVMEVAEKLAAEGVEAAVLDLRSLAPLDRESLLAVARHTSKVMIVHEDSRTGGIGESLAAIIQEEAFEDLDAPVRVIGALDTPVPYSPPLEDAFLPGAEMIEKAARNLLEY